MPVVILELKLRHSPPLPGLQEERITFCWERIHPGCSDALLRVASVYSNLHRIIDVARTNRAGSNLLQQISRNKRKGKDLSSSVFEFRSIVCGT